LVLGRAPEDPPVGLLVGIYGFAMEKRLAGKYFYPDPLNLLNE